MYEGDWNQCLPCISQAAVAAYGDNGDCIEGYDGHWRALQGWGPADPAHFLEWAKVYSYRTQLMPYVKNSGLFFCPSDDYASEENDRWEDGCYITSFHYRLQLAGAAFFGWGPNGSRKPYKATYFNRPAQVVILYENWSMHMNKDHQGLDSRFNVTFMDGHSRSIILREVNATGDLHWIAKPSNGNNTPDAYDTDN